MKNLFLIFSLLMLFSGRCLAASVYVFSGQIDLVTGLSGTADDFYADKGIYAGAIVNFSTQLDPLKNGSLTASDGTVSNLPFYEHSGIITDQHTWYRYASLSASSINIDQSSIGRTYNQLKDLSYWSPNSTPSFIGSIDVGSFLSISKNKAFGDTSAFVENWKVGDSLDFCIDYKDGADEVFASGQLKLMQIDTPLARISTVPLPGAIWLFGSTLIGIFGFRNVAK